MNCQQVDKYILDYCDNKLSPDLAHKIEQHLLNCPMCSKAVDLCKAEGSILYSLANYEPSANFTNKVMDSIRSEALLTTNNVNQTKKIRKPLFMLIPVAAVILLLVTSDLSGIFNMGSKLDQTSSIENSVQDKTPLTQEVRIAQSENINDGVLGYVDKFEKLTTENEKIITKEAHENPTIVYDRQMMKQANSNRAEQIRMASMSSENKLNFIVENVPEEFSLLEVKDGQENSITYSYINDTNQTTLDITITEVTNENTTTCDESTEGDINILMVGPEQELGPEPEPELELEEQETPELPLNNLSWELNQDNQLYIVTLQSNLPEEDIINLFSLITITK